MTNCGRFVADLIAAAPLWNAWPPQAPRRRRRCSRSPVCRTATPAPRATRRPAGTTSGRASTRSVLPTGRTWDAQMHLVRGRNRSDGICSEGQRMLVHSGGHLWASCHSPPGLRYLTPDLWKPTHFVKTPYQEWSPRLSESVHNSALQYSR